MFTTEFPCCYHVKISTLFQQNAIYQDKIIREHHQNDVGNGSGSPKSTAQSGRFLHVSKDEDGFRSSSIPRKSSTQTKKSNWILWHYLIIF